MNIDDIRRQMIIGARFLESTDNELGSIQRDLDIIIYKLEIENVLISLIDRLKLIRNTILKIRLYGNGKSNS
jgi:hypothetical protein